MMQPIASPSWPEGCCCPHTDAGKADDDAINAEITSSIHSTQTALLLRCCCYHCNRFQATYAVLAAFAWSAAAAAAAFSAAAAAAAFSAFLSSLVLGRVGATGATSGTLDCRTQSCNGLQDITLRWFAEQSLHQTRLQQVQPWEP